MITLSYQLYIHLFTLCKLLMIISLFIHDFCVCLCVFVLLFIVEFKSVFRYRETIYVWVNLILVLVYRILQSASTF